MDITLEPIYELIMQAVSAEEVFGVTDVTLPPDDLLAYLKLEYEKLQKITNSEQWTNPDDYEMAVDANERLGEFYKKAQERIEEGIYGLGGLTKPYQRKGPSFSTSKRKYFLGSVMVEGDLSTVYEGFCEIGDESAGEVIIKVVDDLADNDLVQNEIRILQALHEVKAPQWKHLPFLLDTFQTEGRTGIVLRKFNGYDLLEVRERPYYREGIDQKHMVWMLNRTLSVIGFAHSLGIVHGNIEPSHIMIRPKDHNLCILDWSYAALMPSQTEDSFKAYTPIFSPPEVQKKRLPIPASDIYSIGKIMIWLLGGDPETNQMPDRVEDELQRFLKWFVMESPLQRPQDAWKLHKQLSTTIERLWGPRKFLHFKMD